MCSITDECSLAITNNQETKEQKMGGLGTPRPATKSRGDLRAPTRSLHGPATPRHSRQPDPPALPPPSARPQLGLPPLYPQQQSQQQQQQQQTGQQQQAQKKHLRPQLHPYNPCPYCRIHNDTRYTVCQSCSFIINPYVSWMPSVAAVIRKAARRKLIIYSWERENGHRVLQCCDCQSKHYNVIKCELCNHFPCENCTPLSVTSSSTSMLW